MEYKLSFLVDAGHDGFRDIAWRRFELARTFLAVPRVGDHVMLWNDSHEDFPEQLNKFGLECAVYKVIWWMDDFGDGDYHHAHIYVRVEDNLLS